MQKKAKSLHNLETLNRIKKENSPKILPKFDLIKKKQPSLDERTFSMQPKQSFNLLNHEDLIEAIKMNNMMLKKDNRKDLFITNEQESFGSPKNISHYLSFCDKDFVDSKILSEKKCPIFGKQLSHDFSQVPLIISEKKIRNQKIKAPFKIKDFFHLNEMEAPKNEIFSNKFKKENKIMEKEKVVYAKHLANLKKAKMLKEKLKSDDITEKIKMDEIRKKNLFVSSRNNMSKMENILNVANLIDNQINFQNKRIKRIFHSCIKEYEIIVNH